MSDGDQTEYAPGRYRNVSGHPEDLADGRVVGSEGEESFVELSEKDVKDSFNAQMLEQGSFLYAPEPKPPSKRELTELKKKAEGLGVENAEDLDDNELLAALGAAEAAKAAEADQSQEGGDA